MDLPGRLRSTTLGDLLGALHRAASTGTLELAEDRGRVHRIFLAQGLVTAVELDGASPSLAEILRNDRAADEDVLRRSLLRAMASQRLHGEVLVEDFRLSPEVVGNALRRQVLARLAALDGLTDARVSFRVAVRAPRGAFNGREVDGTGGGRWAPPLRPSEFLHGRKRRRERAGCSSQYRPAGAQSASPGGGPRPEASHRAGTGGAPRPAGDPRAWRVLGLSPGADPTEIKRAYRRLARTVHPDLHPEANDDERRTLQARFVEITAAYQALVA